MPWGIVGGEWGFVVDNGENLRGIRKGLNFMENFFKKKIFCNKRYKS